MGGGHWGQGLALLSAGWPVTLLAQSCLEFGSRDVHIQPAAGRGGGCLCSAFLLSRCSASSEEEEEGRSLDHQKK